MASVYLRCNDTTLVEVSWGEALSLLESYPELEIIHKCDGCNIDVHNLAADYCEPCQRIINHDKHRDALETKRMQMVYG